MSPSTRIIGFSLLTAGLGAGLAAILFGNFTEAGFLYVLLGCVGAIIGAVAGAAREIADALRQRNNVDPSSSPSQRS